MLQLLEKWTLIYFFPLSYNRVILIYLHGKSVVIGFQAWGIQIWKDKPANRNYFPCVATKQSTDEMIRAMHWSATLRAVSMGLRNYPSSKSQIPPQMGRTHIPIFSEWKAESAWPWPKWDPDEPNYPDETGHSRGQGKIPQTAIKCQIIVEWCQ